MKRKELSFVEAYKAFTAGKPIVIHYTGLFNVAYNRRIYSENLRPLQSETTVFSGMIYDTDTRHGNVMNTFREAIIAVNCFMRSYALDGAKKYIVRYFTETEPKTVQPETVKNSDMDYYLPFN